MDLAESVYALTDDFPRREWFGIVVQLRRAAVSVPSNIAEGHGRITRGEWQQFLGHARGSLLEVHTQLLLSRRLKFGTDELLRNVTAQCEEVGRILNGLLRSTYRREPRKAPQD